MFKETITLDYDPFEEQELIFKVWDIDDNNNDITKADFLGEMQCTLEQLVDCTNFSKALRYEGADFGKIFVSNIQVSSSECNDPGFVFSVLLQIKTEKLQPPKGGKKGKKGKKGAGAGKKKIEVGCVLHPHQSLFISTVLLALCTCPVFADSFCFFHLISSFKTFNTAVSILPPNFHCFEIIIHDSRVPVNPLTTHNSHPPCRVMVPRG